MKIKEELNETTRMQLILKNAWQLAFDIAVRTMTIEEAQEQAWMKVSGCVNLIIKDKQKQYEQKILNAVNSFYVDCNEDGSYSCDPSINQFVDEIIKRIQEKTNEKST